MTPIPPTSIQTPPSLSPQQPPRFGKDLQVLVADDSPDLRALYRLFIEDHNTAEDRFEIHEAKNKTQAAQLLQSKPFDLVITDNRMSVKGSKDGLEVLQAAKQASPRPVSVMICGDSTLEQASKDAGADHVLLKGSTDLLERLQQILTAFTTTTTSTPPQP